MDANGISCTRDGDVAEITLNRPAKRNALREQDVASLRSAVQASGSGGARAILIRAEGPAFCAGRDLSEAKPGQNDAHLHRPLAGGLEAEKILCP